LNNYIFADFQTHLVRLIPTLWSHSDISKFLF
jgi:hypothetical protein